MAKKKIIPQAQWIHDFNQDFRPKFNDELFARNNEDIVEEVSKVIRSCEKDKYFTLKVLSIDTITDYEEIYNTLRDHYERRKKKNDKRPNPYDYINIKDSAILLLKIKYFIQKNGTERMKVDGKDMDVENPNTILEVLIELPRYVNKYYFRLQGNYYNTIYQIVDGSTYNGEDDPRVTKIGRLLRKTSIDELPQILNILNGTMSLIGPRPDPPDDMLIYTERQKEKLKVKPGLTGYNQAFFRNSVEQIEKFEHDLYYANNVSFWLDVKIFFKTIITVLRHESIYNVASAPTQEEINKLSSGGGYRLSLDCIVKRHYVHSYSFFGRCA